MKRTTAIIVGLFAAVLAYYLLVERNAKSSEEIARDAKRLFSFEASQVEAVTIVRPEGTVRVEATEDRKWRMTAPLRARADRWICDAVASALADMEGLREIENTKGSAGLTEKGLAPPRARLEITVAPKVPDEARTPEGGKDEKAAGETPHPGEASGAKTGESPRVLEIGSEVPSTGSVFVRIDGTNEIHLVAEASVGALLKPLADFRDRSLMDVMILDVGEARITRPEGDLRFRRHDGDWWIESPLRDLADGSAVQSLLSALVEMRADSFVDDPFSPADPPPSPGEQGLDPPASSVTLLDKAGREMAAVSLGRPVEGQTGKLYARVRAAGGDTATGIVPSGSLSSLSDPAPEFRSRQALAVRAWETSGLTLVTPETTLSFVKKDGVWAASAPATLTIDPTAVEDTLQALADLEILSFGAPRGTSAASLGLDPPRTRIDVVPESEGASAVTLVLGASAPEPGSIYARSPDRPEVFTVPASILDRIKGGVSLYAAKSAPQDAPPSKVPAADAGTH